MQLQTSGKMQCAAANEWQNSVCNCKRVAKCTLQPQTSGKMQLAAADVHFAAPKLCNRIFELWPQQPLILDTYLDSVVNFVVLIWKLPAICQVKPATVFLPSAYPGPSPSPLPLTTLSRHLAFSSSCTHIIPPPSMCERERRGWVGGWRWSSFIVL